MSANSGAARLLRMILGRESKINAREEARMEGIAKRYESF
jgi:hypothetical protein